MVPCQIDGEHSIRRGLRQALRITVQQLRPLHREERGRLTLPVGRLRLHGSRAGHDVRPVGLHFSAEAGQKVLISRMLRLGTVGVKCKHLTVIFEGIGRAVQCDHASVGEKPFSRGQTARNGITVGIKN